MLTELQAMVSDSKWAEICYCFWKLVQFTHETLDRRGSFKQINWINCRIILKRKTNKLSSICCPKFSIESLDWHDFLKWINWIDCRIIRGGGLAVQCAVQFTNKSLDCHRSCKWINWISCRIEFETLTEEIHFGLVFILDKSVKYKCQI